MVEIQQSSLFDEINDPQLRSHLPETCRDSFQLFRFLSESLEAPTLMNRTAAIFTQTSPADRLRATLDLMDTIWRHDGELCQLFEDMREDFKVNGLYRQEASRYDKVLEMLTSPARSCFLGNMSSRIFVAPWRLRFTGVWRCSFPLSSCKFTISWTNSIS